MSWQISITTCEFTWWEHLIWTLVPFLLGLLLGYLLWYRYRQRILRLENEMQASRDQILALQADLTAETPAIAEMEIRIKRLESDLSGSRLAYSTLQNRYNSLKIAQEKVQAVPVPVIKPVDRKDPLTEIEGIGPKAEALLYTKDIKTFRGLANIRVPALRKILSTAGPNFRILDPGTWPKQAKIAADGNWDKLRKYQDTLIGGREPGKARPDPDLSGIAALFGKKFKFNDLKLIEGIGPKIEKLLQQGGISTWWELADSSLKTIQEILDDAGSRYRLAKPGTWPRQARMAARGNWKKLRLYQDELDGGKE